MTSSPSPTRLRPGCHGYLAIEGLVALADLLPLLVAPGCDQLQYGLLVTAWKRGGHLSPYPYLPPGSPPGLPPAILGPGPSSGGGGITEEDLWGPAEPPLGGITAHAGCELRGPAFSSSSHK